MSITIVSSFVEPAVPGPSAKGRASELVAVDDSSSGLDFASILQALPVGAAPLPSSSDREALAGGMATLPEAAPVFDDPQFLAVLGLNQPNLLHPFSPIAPMPPTGGSEGSAMAAQLDLSLPTRNPPPLLTPPGTSVAGDSTHRSDAGSDASEPPVATALISDGKAAKFAVATLVTQAIGQGETKRPEQQPSSASHLATLAPTSPTPNTNTTAGLARETSPSLQTPLRDPAWATDFGQKLLWFAGNDKQLAQLTLNPPQLGSVEITLKIDKDSATAHFVSANADVRGAIETAVPRLREMFASAGIDLGQVSVGSEAFHQQADSQRQPSGPPRPMADTAILGNDLASALAGQSVVTHRGSALVDIFA